MDQPLRSSWVENLISVIGRDTDQADLSSLALGCFANGFRDQARYASCLHYDIEVLAIGLFDGIINRYIRNQVGVQALCFLSQLGQRKLAPLCQCGPDGFTFGAEKFAVAEKIRGGLDFKNTLGGNRFDGCYRAVFISGFRA